MEQALTFNFGNDLIRFTPDGRVSVMDAIQAVLDSGRASMVWKNLKSDHPEVLAFCEEYPFQEGEAVLVTGSEGWEKIWMLLPYYLSDEDLIDILG